MTDDERPRVDDWLAGFQYDMGRDQNEPLRISEVRGSTDFDDMMARAGTYTRTEKFQRFAAYCWWGSIQWVYYRMMAPWWHRRETPDWVVLRPAHARNRWLNTKIRSGTITVKGKWTGRDV